MKSIMFSILSLFILNSASASFSYVGSGSYICSDGKTYDVARYIEGGWGPANYSLVGFCSAGTLSQPEYGGWSTAEYIVETNEELATCQAEDNPELIRCMEEYLEVNQTRRGLAAKIINHDLYTGGACEERISRAQNIVNNIRESLEQGRFPEIHTQVALNEAIRNYGIVMTDCPQQGTSTPEEPASTVVVE